MPKKPPPGKGKGPRKRPEKESEAERRYWKREAEVFRKKFPKAARQRDAVRKLADSLLSPLIQWRKTRTASESAWLAVEDFLLSAKKGQKKFLRLLAKAQERSIAEIQEEVDFFHRREAAMRSIMGHIDPRDAYKVIYAVDRAQGLRAESEFFGLMADLAKKGALAEFGKLLFSQQKNPQYVKAKEWYSAMQRNLEKAIDDFESHARSMRQAFREGRVGRQRYYEWISMAQIFQLQQFGNMAEAEVRVYSLLRRQAKNPKVKELLRIMEIKSRREFLRYQRIEQELTRDFPRQL
jgi:hypothetical protein